MALIGNYSVLTKGPGRFLAGSTTSAEVGVRSNWTKSGATRNRLYVDQSATANYKRAEPQGYYPPYTNFIPQTRGELGTSSHMVGAGALTGSGALGMAVAASLTGDGALTALGQLVVSAAANLSGGGNITAADLRGFLLAVANLSGSGDLAAAIRADAQMASGVTGAGTVSSSSVVRASGAMEANILSYGALTPEGIRDSVWAKVIESGYTAEQMLRIITAHAAGAATGLEGANPVFKGLDGTTTRIDGGYAAGTRTINSLNGS